MTSKGHIRCPLEKGTLFFYFSNVMPLILRSDPHHPFGQIRQAGNHTSVRGSKSSNPSTDISVLRVLLCRAAVNLT